MGLRYEKGEGVRKDATEAYAFYRLAESKNEDAKNSLKKLSKIMTEKELSKGNKRFEKLNI
jgi:TPR repeat protein